MLKREKGFGAYSYRSFVWIAVLCAQGFYFFQDPVTIIDFDSPEYLEYAHAIASNRSPFISRDEAQRSFALSNRTPGYPMLILLFGLGRFSLVSGVLSLHLVFLMLASITTMFTFRSHIPPFVTGVAVGMSLAPLEGYARSVLPEWICACLMLLLAVQLFVLCRVYSNRSLFGLTLCISALVLCRPPMLVTFLVLICAYIVHMKSFGPKPLCVMLLGLSPILIWMVFNSLRIGTPSLAAALGYSRFAAVSAILPVRLDESDSSELHQFFLEFQKIKRPPGDTWMPVSDAYLPNGLFASYFGHNLNEVIRRIPIATGWNYIQLHDVLSSYATKAISQNFRLYLQFSWEGMLRIRESSYLVWLALLAPFFWRRGHAYWPLGLTGSCFAVMHVSHVFLVATQGIVVDRFLLLTAQPAECLGLLVLACIIRDMWSKLKKVRLSSRAEFFRTPIVSHSSLDPDV